MRYLESSKNHTDEISRVVSSSGMSENGWFLFSLGTVYQQNNREDNEILGGLEESNKLPIFEQGEKKTMQITKIKNETNISLSRLQTSKG